MFMPRVDELNKQFGITDHLQFEMIDDHIVCCIKNDYATAKVSTYGGQILSFLPNSEMEDVLFLSEKAVYQAGKALRGGVPVCWPWFGDDDSGFGRPSHGFARNQPWDVFDCKQNDDGSTTIVLSLSDTDGSLAVWPYRFNLLITVNIAQTLTVTLTTINTGTKAFPLTQALHTYFKVSDVKHVKVSGLNGHSYLDKLTHFSSYTQTGDVIIDKEVDRVYLDVNNNVTLHDAGFKVVFKNLCHSLKLNAYAYKE